ncbi:MAG: beta-lactamase family protein [Zhongshania sp.]|jgi:CubicO group peptidase (beta-lactamase class C family)|nr:beta-lactamase family protein [Zhongshania sp.]
MTVKILMPRFFSFWLLNILTLGVILVAPFSHAEAVTQSVWPVSVAKEGFSSDQRRQVLSQYSPSKLAAGENQALYSYLHMAEFFPHHILARSGEIKKLSLNSASKLGAVTAITALGELSLDELLAHPDSRVQGILVLHQGQLALERYPGMRATDTHLWWSIAKIFAGLSVEILRDEGKIDKSLSITSYLPEFEKSAWSGVSVESVLNMASGMDALDSPQAYADPNSGIGGLIYAEGILSSPKHTPLGHNQALSKIPRLQAPGRVYQYSSANTNMLALLIERVSGKPYAEFIEDRIWSRIGAEGDGLMGLSPDGHAIAHGMYSSRLRDLGRFGLLFTPTGYNASVFSPQLMSRISRTQENKHYQNAVEAAKRAGNLLGEKPVNALAQWDALFADGDLFKSGFDGQALYISPSRDVVIAVFSTSKDKSIYRYLRAIASQFPVQIKSKK